MLIKKAPACRSRSGRGGSRVDLFRYQSDTRARMAVRKAL